ncbi:MAG: hypothetical protein RJB39_723 [Candidatus Parcubacteria bacterium]
MEEDQLADPDWIRNDPPGNLSHVLRVRRTSISDPGPGPSAICSRSSGLGLLHLAPEGVEASSLGITPLSSQPASPAYDQQWYRTFFIFP